MTVPSKQKLQITEYWLDTYYFILTHTSSCNTSRLSCEDLRMAIVRLCNRVLLYVLYTIRLCMDIKSCIKLCMTLVDVTTLYKHETETRRRYSLNPKT
jgi:hypothetical protein